MPAPERDPNYTYFDSQRTPAPGSEYQNNMNRYPMGPYDPSGPQYPGWVDPNSGYKIEYNVDGQPYYAWYPNGEYQGGNPFIDGDAFMERAMYPRYTADRLPDPNWRPSRPGERPPWMNAPEPDDTPESRRRMDAYSNMVQQRSANHQSEREAALAAGAKLIKVDKRIPGWANANSEKWYYPPGYKGPRVKSLGSDVDAPSISDVSVLGPEGGAWRFVDNKGNTVGGNQPAQAGPQPSGPAPGAPAPGPAPAPQMSWEDQEAGRRQEWEAGGRKGTEYFDRYGNYNPDGYSSGPQRTMAEQQYLAEQTRTNPLFARGAMFDAGDWAGQDMQKRMKTVKGVNGTERMMWDPSRQSQINQSFTPEQRAAAEAKMAAFNKQFDPNNIAGNPAYAREAEFQQMERFHKNFDPNGTPYQRAQYAKYQQMLAERQGGGQQPPAPAPKPGPMPAPKSMGAPAQAQGAPVTNPAVANMGDARFHNGNPYYNAKGNLRMPFRNAIANQMVSGIGGNDSGTSYNMGGQNGQALFGTQNNYGYWPQGQQQNNMAKQANPYGASPQAAMNFYGGYGY